MKFTAPFFSLLSLTLTSFTKPVVAKAIDVSLALDLPEGFTAYQVSPEEIPIGIRNAAVGQTERPEAPSKLWARANPYLPDPGVYMCTNSGFTGSCWYIKTAHYVCFNFPSAWNDVFSSIGPDVDQQCRFYIHGGCEAVSGNPYIWGWYPGHSNLAVDPPLNYVYNGVQYYNANDRLSSVQCAHYWAICETEGIC